MRLAALILASTLPIVPSGAATDAAIEVERRVETMGTTLRVVVDAPSRAAALTAAEAAIEAVLAAEARLSTWTPDSELSRFNASPVGTSFSLSPLLARDLAEAARCSRATAGAFTPGVGALVQAWGLRMGGRVPIEGEIERGRRAADLAHLRLTGQTATRADVDFIVEEGAFGKGAGLDDAIAALERTTAAAAVLDLGGQVTLWGGAATTIDIADPRDRDIPVLRMTASGGSISTSGNSERGITIDGRRLGHLLDPRSGRPAPDFGSMTVWSESSTRADCLATGLFVLGPAEARRWATRHHDVAIVVLEIEGDTLVAHASVSLRDRLQPLVPAIELRWIRP